MASTSNDLISINEDDELVLKDYCFGDDIECLDDIQTSGERNSTGKTGNLRPSSRGSGRKSTGNSQSLRDKSSSGSTPYKRPLVRYDDDSIRSSADQRPVNKYKTPPTSTKGPNQSDHKKDNRSRSSEKDKGHQSQSTHQQQKRRPSVDGGQSANSSAKKPCLSEGKPLTGQKGYNASLREKESRFATTSNRPAAEGGPRPSFTSSNNGASMRPRQNPPPVLGARPGFAGELPAHLRCNIAPSMPRQIPPVIAHQTISSNRPPRPTHFNGTSGGHPPVTNVRPMPLATVVVWESEAMREKISSTIQGLNEIHCHEPRGISNYQAPNNANFNAQEHILPPPPPAPYYTTPHRPAAQNSYGNVHGNRNNQPPIQLPNNTVPFQQQNQTPTVPKAGGKELERMSLHELIFKLSPKVEQPIVTASGSQPSLTQVQPTTIASGSQAPLGQVQPSNASPGSRPSLVKVHNVKQEVKTVEDIPTTGINPSGPLNVDQSTGLNAQVSNDNDAMEICHSDSDVPPTCVSSAGAIETLPIQDSSLNSSFNESGALIIDESWASEAVENSTVAPNKDKRSPRGSRPSQSMASNAEKEPGEISDDEERIDSSVDWGKKLVLESQLKEIRQKVEDLEKSDRKSTNFLLALCVDQQIALATQAIACRVYEEKDVVNVANQKNREKIARLNGDLKNFQHHYDKKKAELAEAEKGKEEAKELKSQNEALKADVKAKATTIDELQRRLLQLETNHSEMLEWQKSLDQNVQSARAERDQAKRERDAFKQQLARVDVQDQKAKSCLAGYNEAVKKSVELKREFEKQAKNLEESTKEKRKAESKSSELEAKLSDREGRLKAAAEKLKQSEKELADKTAALESTLNDKEVLMTKIQGLEKGYKELLQKVKNKETAEKNRVQSLEELQQRAKEVAEKRKELDKTIEGVKTTAQGTTSREPSTSSTNLRPIKNEPATSITE